MSTISQASITIISGVLIFVFGQLYLRGILEPALALRGKISSVDNLLYLLIHQHSHTGLTHAFTEENIESLGNLAADVLSYPRQILYYCIMRCLFGFPTYRKLKNSSKKLNDLSCKCREIRTCTSDFDKLLTSRVEFPSTEKVNEFDEKAKKLDEQFNKLDKEKKNLITEIREELRIL